MPFLGLGVSVGLGVGLGVGDGVAVGSGVSSGVGVGVSAGGAVGTGVGRDGSGVNVAAGVGDAVGDGVGSGVGSVASAERWTGLSHNRCRRRGHGAGSSRQDCAARHLSQLAPNTVYLLLRNIQLISRNSKRPIHGLGLAVHDNLPDPGKEGKLLSMSFDAQTLVPLHNGIRIDLLQLTRKVGGRHILLGGVRWTLLADRLRGPRRCSRLAAIRRSLGNPIARSGDRLGLAIVWKSYTRPH